ncbi:unnamed protein product [Parnassius apollo]|uniref:(apollo) hypothetical protein n=1 Tax=Parnassius apollo TaxID=110799 RepID=A0A8S3WMS6_PARAO|nr:unnamed protein product [Parnassius apollo]
MGATAELMVSLRCITMFLLKRYLNWNSSSVNTSKGFLLRLHFIEIADIGDTNENTTLDKEVTLDNTAQNSVSQEKQQEPAEKQPRISRPGKKNNEPDKLANELLTSIRDHFKRPAASPPPQEDRYDLLGIILPRACGDIKANILRFLASCGKKSQCHSKIIRVLSDNTTMAPSKKSDVWRFYDKIEGKNDCKV